MSVCADLLTVMDTLITLMYLWSGVCLPITNHSSGMHWAFNFTCTSPPITVQSESSAVALTCVGTGCVDTNLVAIIGWFKTAFIVVCTEYIIIFVKIYSYIPFNGYKDTLAPESIATQRVAGVAAAGVAADCVMANLVTKVGPQQALVDICIILYYALHCILQSLCIAS